jgi:diacylglycerol kinase (ATP)
VNPYGPRRFLRAVGFARSGWTYVWRTQPPFRIEVAVAAIAIASALALRTGVAAVVLASALVLVAELVNTAVETAVDLAGPSPHPLAAVAKDAAAAAVLVAALGAVAVGLATFGPPLWSWLAAALLG